MLRMNLSPRSYVPSGAIGAGGRSARSLIETMHPIAVWATCACGAAARNSFIAPHSSDSRCPNMIQRSRSSGTTEATACDTSGNMPRGPVWKMVGGELHRAADGGAQVDAMAPDVAGETDVEQILERHPAEGRSERQRQVPCRRRCAPPPLYRLRTDRLELRQDVFIRKVVALSDL